MQQIAITIIQGAKLQIFLSIEVDKATSAEPIHDPTSGQLN